jgi:hypothetical protein
MTLQEYIDQLKPKFAQYGFTETPIPDSYIIRLYAMGADLDKAYGVGCDVAAGFGFMEAVKVKEYTVIWRAHGDSHYMHSQVLLLDDIDLDTMDLDQWVDKAHLFEYADCEEEDGYMAPDMMPSIAGYNLIAVLRGPLEYIY